MKRSKLLAGALITFGAFSLLAGCQQAGGPSKPPEEVIKEGLTKLTELTSYSYEVAFKGDMKDPVVGASKIDATLSGNLDVKDPKDPKFTLKLAGSQSDDKGGGGDASFDLRFNKEAVYFNVMSLSMKGGGELPAEITSMFAKWWKITLPPEAADEVTKSVPQGEEAKLTPEQLRIKKLMEETKFFTQPKYVNTEDVKGESSYHYSVTVDKKALLDFFKKAAEQEGAAIGAAEMAETEKAFENMDITGDVYVGATSGVMNKFVGAIALKDTEAGATGTISLSVVIGDINKPVALDVPAGAEEFPIEEIMSAMFGGGMAPTGDDASMMDPTLLDPSLSGGESFEFAPDEVSEGSGSVSVVTE